MIAIVKLLDPLIDRVKQPAEVDFHAIIRDQRPPVRRQQAGIRHDFVKCEPPPQSQVRQRDAAFRRP